MRIVSILGARPQFIKAAAVSRIISKHPDIHEVIIHTGQHFDENMSNIFFRQMQIPEPDYNLDIHDLNHGAMTGRMLERIEEVMLKEQPDWVLVYGDTNSTLAGCLAAKKLHFRVAHVEAGLRSFNMKMPEEINRILTDRISDILFCPTERAVENLKNEGFDNINTRIVKSGDVMKDTALFYSDMKKKPDINVPEKFVLVSIHRAENTDDLQRLNSIIRSLNIISKEISIIFPLHPRTRKIIESNNIKLEFNVIEPVGYLEMIYLFEHCKLVMTDSGGMQKEAFLFNRPCVTLRDETEWVELVENGFNIIANSEEERIYNCYKQMIEKELNFNIDLYGKGNASEIIVKELNQ